MSTGQFVAGRPAVVITGLDPLIHAFGGQNRDVDSRIKSTAVRYIFCCT